MLIERESEKKNKRLHAVEQESIYIEKKRRSVSTILLLSKGGNNMPHTHTHCREHLEFREREAKEPCVCVCVWRSQPTLSALLISDVARQFCTILLLFTRSNADDDDEREHTITIFIWHADIFYFLLFFYIFSLVVRPRSKRNTPTTTTIYNIGFPF